MLHLVKLSASLSNNNNCITTLFLGRRHYISLKVIYASFIACSAAYITTYHHRLLVPLSPDQCRIKRHHDECFQDASRHYLSALYSDARYSLELKSPCLSSKAPRCHDERGLLRPSANIIRWSGGAQLMLSMSRCVNYLRCHHHYAPPEAWQCHQHAHNHRPSTKSPAGNNISAEAGVAVHY